MLPILRAKCLGCHVGSGTSGVSLSSYSQVIGSIGVQYGEAVVSPGDADASPLVDKLLASPQFGQRMPEGSQLSASEIATIRQWIDEGANDN
ncbi:MAG: hypothetical protein KDD65_05840 [Bacteroidetes bacterium]|nr:hypothetical protein [Bacteroidota bacterium]